MTARKAKEKPAIKALMKAHCRNSSAIISGDKFIIIPSAAAYRTELSRSDVQLNRIASLLR